MALWEEPGELFVLTEDAGWDTLVAWMSSNAQQLNLLAMVVALGVMAFTYCLRHVFTTQRYDSMKSDTQFLQILRQSQMQLRKGRDGAVQMADVAKILAFVRGLSAGDEERYSAGTRVAAAGWMVLYFNCGHMLTDRVNRTGGGVEPTTADYEVMWRLVGDLVKYESEEEEKNGMLVRIDVASAMQDAEKLMATYTRIMSHQSTFTQNELLNVYAIASVLGHWADVRVLGDRCLKGEATLFELIHKLVCGCYCVYE